MVPEGPGGRVARPSTLRWDLETGTNEGASWVTATGWSEDLVQAICITVRPGAQWFEVTECLSSSEVRKPLGVTGFQSQWHFAPGGVIGEVFTPNLIPIEGDLVGQHVLRSPVLVAESAGVGVVLAVDVDVLRKARVPAALSLLRASDDEADLVVGLHRQEIREHVFHQERGGAIGPEVQTLWHCYHLGFFPKPQQGTSLAAARKKIWSIARADGASRPLDQTAEEYARQIYPRAIEQLWRETVVDGRRVGAITTNRSYRGDVWFSCWFNPLRGSYGLYHYGGVLGRDDWVAMARATRSLALAAPLSGGFLPTVFVFGEDRWVESHHQGGGPGIFHVMDISWTMYQLLRWHHDLEPDEESVIRARTYASALAAVQRPDGGLPAYIDKEGNPVTSVDRAGADRGPGGPGRGPLRARDDEVALERRPLRCERGGRHLALISGHAGSPVTSRSPGFERRRRDSSTNCDISGRARGPIGKMVRLRGLLFVQPKDPGLLRSPLRAVASKHVVHAARRGRLSQPVRSDRPKVLPATCRPGHGPDEPVPASVGPPVA